MTAVPRVMVNGANHGSKPRMENMMAKTSKPATAAFQQISDAIDSVNKKVEVPAAARDFVKRTAATTRQRAEAVHATPRRRPKAPRSSRPHWSAATPISPAACSTSRSPTSSTRSQRSRSWPALARSTRRGSAGRLRARKRARQCRTRPQRGQFVKSVVADGAKTVQAEISKIYGFGQQAA